MSGWADLPFDEEHATRTCVSFLSEVNKTAFISGGGYIAGIVQPINFNPALAAIEVLWFAEDGSGMALLRAFRQWAERMGAVKLVLHDHISGGRLADVLAKRGYTSVGRTLETNL